MSGQFSTIFDKEYLPVQIVTSHVGEHAYIIFTVFSKETRDDIVTESNEIEFLMLLLVNEPNE